MKCPHGCADEWYPVFHHEGNGYDHALSDIAWLLDEVRRLRVELVFEREANAGMLEDEA